MRLADFIGSRSPQIVAEWAAFALVGFPDATIAERRDHIEGMLKAIAIDLERPQTPLQQAEKAKGHEDAHVDSPTAANDHGTDRAALGYTPMQMISEFRALRASVLRLWSKEQTALTRQGLEEVTRFNESIDQLLAESIARYTQDVDHAKDLFLGVLGHDLRNPLGAIMMSATVMMRREAPDWPQQKTASLILTCGTRMNGMISDLLDFTRTRLGSGIPVVCTNIDLETLCRETVDEIAAFHPEAVVHFEASGQMHGHWDRGRIAQMLSNLVGNALQHGRATAPVEVALHGSPETVVLTVKNQGAVIPANKLKDIFSPFTQLDPTRSKAVDSRSVGLGLYIAQAIVSAHHGSIDVQSTELGTTFRVRLPRVAAAPS